MIHNSNNHMKEKLYAKPVTSFQNKNNSFITFIKIMHNEQEGQATALYLHVTPFTYNLRNPLITSWMHSISKDMQDMSKQQYIYVSYVKTYSIRPSPLLILPKYSPNTGETRLYRIQPFNGYIYTLSTNIAGPGTGERYQYYGGHDQDSASLCKKNNNP